ncbi:MAG: hypothetical protein AAGJ87_16720, partial [Pseudomonadota bacterium]
MTSVEAVSVHDLTGVPETLLIPLACRARASKEKRFGDFHDPMSEKICDTYDVDLERYASDEATLKGAVARGRWYDEQVLMFIAKNKSAVVFSVGSGLNTMYERVVAAANHSDWRWFDTDVAEVVSLRRIIFGDNEKRRTLEFNALEPSWKSIDALKGDAPFLVITEAVLIYFPESDVSAFFKALADFGRTRARCGVVFDWCSPEMIKRSKAHPALLWRRVVVHLQERCQPDHGVDAGAQLRL